MFFLKSGEEHYIPFFMPSIDDPWTGVPGLVGNIDIYYFNSVEQALYIVDPGQLIVTEIGMGWYLFRVAPDMLNNNGFITFIFTSPSARTQQQVYQVVPFDVYNGMNLGLAHLDAPITSRHPDTPVTVQGYTPGASPASQLLLNPGNKLMTNAFGYVTVAVNTDKSGYGLSTSSVNQVAAAVWDRQKSDHNTAGSFGDLLDAKVSSRHPNAPVTVGAYAAGEDPGTRVWGFSTRTLTTLLNTVSGTTTVADQIWNRLRSEDTRPAGSFGDLLDMKVSSLASIDQRDWTDEEREQIRYILGIDGDRSAPTTPGVVGQIHQKVQPLQFTDGRVHSLVGAYAPGLSPAEQILMDISRRLWLNEGGQVSAAVVSDKTGYTLTTEDKNQIVDLVWDELKSEHTVSGSFGHHLDVPVSSRHPNTPVTVGGYSTGQNPGSLVWGFSSRTLTTVLNIVGAPDTTIADEIWNRSRAAVERPEDSFGYYLDQRVSIAGSEGNTDWTPEEREQIRYALGIDGTQTAPTTTTGYLPAIQSKTAQLQFNAGNVHAVVASYFSGLSPAEQILMNTTNKLLTNSNGHVTVGSNQDKSGYSLSNSSLDAIADRVWDEPKSDHQIDNTFGDYLDTRVSSRHPNANVTVGGYANGQSPADQILLDGNKLHTNASGYVVAYGVLDKSGFSLSNTERSQIADAVWEEPKASHTTPNTFGDHLDAKISSRHPNSNVVVGGYAAGSSPADLILVNPGARLDNTSSGGVKVGAYEPGMSPAAMILMDVTRKLFLTADGGVMVGQYSSGQTPADHVLSQPDNKLSTNAQGEVTVATNKDKSGYSLSSSERQNIAQAVWSFIVEGAYTARSVFRKMAAVLFGNRNVNGNRFTYIGLDGTTERVVGEVDSERNRNIVLLDGE